MLDNTIVFFDAKYLQLINRQFTEEGSIIKCSLNQLAITLAKEQNLWCSKTYYYLAPPYQSEPPTTDEAKRRSSYDNFINKLRKIPNFEVREGRCQKVDGEYHQKGVDTLITMDLMSEAVAHKGMTFILVSCDTDFVPVIKDIKQKFGNRVILYYYNDYVRGSKFSMSNHIMTACDTCVLMKREHFLKSKYEKNSL